MSATLNILQLYINDMKKLLFLLLFIPLIGQAQFKFNSGKSTANMDTLGTRNDTLFIIDRTTGNIMYLKAEPGETVTTRENVADQIHDSLLNVTTVESDPVWISDSSDYAKKQLVNDSIAALDLRKQSTLVSGTNIKTINSTSLLGSGNITITGGGSMTSQQIIDSISFSVTMPVSLKIPFTKPLGEITPYQMTGNTIITEDTANTLRSASTTYQILGADGYSIYHRGNMSPYYGSEEDSVIRTSTGKLYSWVGVCVGSGIYRRFKYSYVDSSIVESEAITLTTPTTFTASALSESEIVLSWDLESTCRYYELDSAHTSGGTWATLNSTIAKTAISYNVTGLDAGQTVYFRLRKLGNGTDSLNSAYATANATTDESAAWSPSDLGAKLLAWWPDARNTSNLQIQDVNRINTWYDAVGSNDLVANSSTTRSYYSVTDGSEGQSTSRLTALYTSNIPRWRWFKYKLNTYSSFNGVMDGGANWRALLSHTSITALQLSNSGGSIARSVNNANWNTVGVYITTTGNNSRLIVNGSEITGNIPFVTDLGGITIHSWGGGGNNSDSDFIEIFETDATIDATDITNITTYLDNL